MKNYKFGLFLDGELRDETNLDENDPEFARELFMGEYGWDVIVNRGDCDDVEVKLIEETEEADDGTTNTFGGDTGIDADFHKKP